MLRALLSGLGWRGAIWGCTFSSRQPRLPPARLLSATELVSHWTVVFEKRGIPEARESSEYIVAHVLGAKTVKCSVVRRAGNGGREDSGEETSRLFHSTESAEPRMMGFFWRNVLGRYLFIHPTNYYSVCQAVGVQGSPRWPVLDPLALSTKETWVRGASHSHSLWCSFRA